MGKDTILQFKKGENVKGMEISKTLQSGGEGTWRTDAGKKTEGTEQGTKKPQK